MIPCRLHIDPPAAGVWNMAVDEGLLEQAAGAGLAALRFYQWCEPTLSLGYFQRYDDRRQHAASAQAAVVRRLSGGGALVHDRELTYSLCLPASHPLAGQSPRLYGVVHAALIDVLGELGVQARLYRDQAPAAEPAAPDEPFLCFARRTAADVVLVHPAGGDAGKIVGSAQRRRRGAVLQHGAVLMAPSSAAPELPAIARDERHMLAPEALVHLLGTALESRLGLRLEPAVYSGEFLAEIERRLAPKHASAAWLMRR